MPMARVSLAIPTRPTDQRIPVQTAVGERLGSFAANVVCRCVRCVRSVVLVSARVIPTSTSKDFRTANCRYSGLYRISDAKL